MALVADPALQDNSTSAMRQRYAHEMCAPTSDFDPDLEALCAGALMSLSPWHYYAGLPVSGHFPMLPGLLPAKKRLEAVVANQTSPPHSLAIHFLIHLMEPANAPASYRWEAEAAAAALDQPALVPSQGHLTHMPSHLWLRIGRYVDGVRASQRAAANNRRYIQKCLNAYGYGHNLKMLVAHARFAGMSGVALDAARETALVAAGEEKSPGGGVACVDCAGTGSPEYVLTLARFGRWEEVLREPLPTDWGREQAAPYNAAAFHYARAMALYALGGGPAATRAADAEAAHAAGFARDCSDDSPVSSVLPLELRAGRAWRVEHDAQKTLELLEQAVVALDGLRYMEPPRWYYPTRHCLGYILLEGTHPMAAGRNVSKALQVFERDLQDFLENGWSLLGASRALRLLHRDKEAASLRERFNKAWQSADVPIESPCPQLSEPATPSAASTATAFAPPVPVATMATTAADNWV